MNITSKHTVGIIGGSGRTGSQFARLFRSLGFSVSVTGKQAESRNAVLVQKCDLVLFSVPLHTSTDVIANDVRNARRKDQLLLDVSSLKSKQVHALLGGKGEVIGMHPLFGPHTDPRNETIILCPARCSKETLASLQKLLKKMELKTVVMTPEEHDQRMLLLQVLPHFKSLLLAGILRQRNVNLSELIGICPPSYKLEFNLLGRFLDDNPDLYGPIILDNPQTLSLLKLLRRLLDRYIAMVERKDLSAFKRNYLDLKRFFGPHAKRARAHSEACIRTLSSLTR